MELMLVLVFLFVLICTGTKHAIVGGTSRLTQSAYKEWVNKMTDPEYEELLMNVFRKKIDTDDAQRIRDEYERIVEENPSCAKSRNIYWSADEWEVPIMLALRGKLPTYHLKYGCFDRCELPGGEVQIKMFKWIESTLRNQGVDITLYTCGLGGSNPREINDVNKVTSRVLSWRAKDSRGEIMRYA